MSNQLLQKIFRGKFNAQYVCRQFWWNLGKKT